MKKLVQLKNKENENLDPINFNYEKRLQKLETVVLFKIPDTNENFNLSQSPTDFSNIEIFFHSILGYKGSIKVPGTSTLIPLNSLYRNPNYENFEVVGCELFIDSTKVKMQNFYIVSNGTINDTTHKYIYVDEIIGYK